MPPKRISLLGVGLLGGSIGLAVKSTLNNCKVIGYGHRPQTLAEALSRGAIDEAAATPQQAAQGSDLVILCTPVGLFGEILTKIGPTLAAEAIITDVGSTKRSVVALAEKHLANPSRFVGSHPIAGSEKRGVQAARADLFRNALCLTTPTGTTDPSALEAVEEFWRILGMRVSRLTPADHDKLLADVSHLPHALAAALVAMQTERSLPLCGKGFLDLTRIAAGDGALWRDIFLDNRDNMADGIARLQTELTGLKRLLETGDEQAIKAWLDAAAARRKGMEGRGK